MSEYILRVENVSKSFPGVNALCKVHLDIKKGEIHALIGENGAGKSTLMKVLTGVNKPDSGSIFLSEKEYNQFDIAEAKSLGISMVYQEIHDIPFLTVAENIFFGREYKKGIFMDYKKLYEETKGILDVLGIKLNPYTAVKNLSIAFRQIVEIAKALSKGVKVLIMDEPTAPLTNDEVDILFKLIKKLKNEGVSIIYISHRLEEIFQICDRVTVLRDGNYVATKEITQTNKDELIKLMVGRDLTNQYPERVPVIDTDTSILKIEKVFTHKLKDVTFELRKGEILGIGGLVGSGRTELLRAIFGCDKKLSGKIFLKGKEITIKTPRNAISNRIVLIPEDRKKQGLLLKMSVKDNISFPNLKELKKFLFLDNKKIKRVVGEYIEKLKIKTPNENQLIRNLSGGNQQKVVISKWLVANAEIIMFDEPTRGIDVGAKYEIYNLMNQLKREGKSIIMVTSDMPELIGMSDRVIVMCDGKISGTINDNDVISQEKILGLASDFNSKRVS